MKTLIFCAFTEKSDIQGWVVLEKLIQRGGFPKKGGLGQFVDLGGGGGWLVKKVRGVVLRGG